VVSLCSIRSLLYSKLDSLGVGEHSDSGNRAVCVFGLLVWSAIGFDRIRSDPLNSRPDTIAHSHFVRHTYVKFIYKFGKDLYIRERIHIAEWKSDTINIVRMQKHLVHSHTYEKILYNIYVKKNTYLSGWAPLSAHSANTKAPCART